MAVWQNIMLSVVRNLTGDFGTPPIFTDDRIVQSVVVSALIVQQEYDFSTSYTLDLESFDIIPDPCVTETLDPIAMTLFGLKAACMLDGCRLRNVAGSAVLVKDGDTEIDTTNSYKGLQQILQIGPCAAYATLLKRKSILKSMSLGKAIMGPMSHKNFYGGLTSNIGLVARTFELSGGI